ncbi:hypothetical protein BO70DRAFT_35255 [Aspergillus heteromorphus CBS 117.55]|uniref:C2H2-type domain-containing protein n=1 Tax=Aspergillus heteromorphus CBS 117.55 TaxID=1448321 RepID=A0A317W9V8_9EURO|nr:uncharacterized protein BO70DRAFT_35255 [Aspergillus heteromorphus CBS 117.55]PWY82092.1 hypothetical protein BO70DRAFT_35255 [Aspergillus heteromorphus CBS 117.55]
MSSHAGCSPTLPPTFPCRWDHCMRAFKRNADLRRHVVTVHVSLRDQRCTLCDYSSPRRDHLQDHLRRAHGVVVPVRAQTGRTPKQ